MNDEFREFANLTDSIPNPHDRCHICSGGDDVAFYEFGLAKKLKVKRDFSDIAIWFAKALASVIVRIPGLSTIVGLGKEREYLTLSLYLQACKNCKQCKGSKWGELPFGLKYYRLHPHWKIARKLGFKEFVPPWRV